MWYQIQVIIIVVIFDNTNISLSSRYTSQIQELTIYIKEGVRSCVWGNKKFINWLRAEYPKVVSFLELSNRQPRVKTSTWLKRWIQYILQTNTVFRKNYIITLPNSHYLKEKIQTDAIKINCTLKNMICDKKVQHT